MQNQKKLLDLQQAQFDALFKSAKTLTRSPNDKAQRCLNLINNGLLNASAPYIAARLARLLDAPEMAAEFETAAENAANLGN